MLKRFEIALAAVVGMALTLAACEPQEVRPQSDEGEAQVVVRGLSYHQIDRMVVTARPASVSHVLVYNSNTGTFSGRMVLPAGEQTLTVEGYSSSYVRDGGSSDAGRPDEGPVDGGSTDGGSVDAGTSDGGSSDPSVPPPDGGTTGGGSSLVATGSATVTITAGNSTTVTLRIYDTTPPPSQGDIGPLIRSMQASHEQTTVGTSIQLSVDAVDLDGDALSYAWTSSCMSSGFSSPFSATTAWSSGTSGACRLSVTVSSRSQSVTESVEVMVFSAPVDGGPGEGSLQVDGEYIARPYISSLFFYGPGVPSTHLHRYYYYNAALPGVQMGTTYYLDMNLDYGTRFGTFAHTVESDCGGTAAISWDGCTMGGSCSARYTWTAPSTAAACKLTLRATNGPLTDSFSVGFIVK